MTGAVVADAEAGVGVGAVVAGRLEAAAGTVDPVTDGRSDHHGQAGGER
jgi:hypothetical protein